MIKEFGALDRLALPDALHTKVCKKLGISLTQDYDIVKLALLELEAIKEAKPSKATKALDRIYQSRSTNKTATKDYEIIKQALQRLEQINNTNPSEALKAVNNDLEGCYEYEKRTGINNVVSMAISKELLIKIQQSLIKAQEQEEDIIHYKGTVDNLRRDNALLKELNAEKKKVLEIIKEKCLHNDNLNYVAVCINYDMYKELMSKKYDNEVVKINWNDKVLLDYLKLLKEEEFDLLKEVF